MSIISVAYRRVFLYEILTIYVMKQPETLVTLISVVHESIWILTLKASDLFTFSARSDLDRKELPSIFYEEIRRPDRSELFISGSSHSFLSMLVRNLRQKHISILIG